MLVVDAIVTLVTTLPFNLYLSIVFANEESFFSTYSFREIFTMDVLLSGIMLTNCFTSPIVYYTFNNSFRVRKENM